MHNYKKSFIGAYYIIVGAIFAFIVWPFGKELIDIIVKMLGIILTRPNVCLTRPFN